jgi:hypothetical protein
LDWICRFCEIFRALEIYRLDLIAGKMALPDGEYP